MKLRKRDNPWKLKTPPQTSDYEMYVDKIDGQDVIVCTVGSTVLHYDYRCLEDLHEMLFVLLLDDMDDGLADHFARLRVHQLLGACPGANGLVPRSDLGACHERILVRGILQLP